MDTKYVVLMPVYNAGAYLTEAIDSILNQSFSDFQLLIINDCSTDSSAATIESYTDNRVVYVKNDQNLRLAKTLNKGLALAKDAAYIFRMDQDDIAHPDRLKLQIQYLDENPEVGAVGSKLKIIDSNQVIDYPIGKENVKAHMLFHNPLGHPSVALRNSFLQRHQLAYREDIYTEDYDFWVRCSAFFKMDNIDSYLINYRQHEGQMTGKTEKILADIRAGRQYQLSNYLKLSLRPEQLDGMHKCFDRELNSEKELAHAQEAFALIRAQNKEHRHYDSVALDNLLLEHWAGGVAKYRSRFYSPKVSVSDVKEYFFSSYGHYRSDNFIKRLRVIKNLLISKL